MPASGWQIGGAAPRIGRGIIYINLGLVGGCFEFIVLAANRIHLPIQGHTANVIAWIGHRGDA